MTPSTEPKSSLNNQESRLLPAYSEHLRKPKSWVRLRKNSKPSTALGKWYRDRAANHFSATLDSVLPLFNKFPIQKPSIQLLSMRTRWGSCTPDGKIILNLELIKAPKGSIDYVIIHELCHLIHHNHTKAFYALQEKIMPDWRRWQDMKSNIVSTLKP